MAVLSVRARMRAIATRGRAGGGEPPDRWSAYQAGVEPAHASQPGDRMAAARRRELFIDAALPTPTAERLGRRVADPELRAPIHAAGLKVVHRLGWEAQIERV
jgi:hypothetical protein